MDKTFNFHSDCGHGWLAVKIADLGKVNLPLNDISNYSFVRGKTVYLEEDCDAPKFIKAYEATYGTSMKYVEKHTSRSTIRSYDSICALRRIAA